MIFVLVIVVSLTVAGTFEFCQHRYSIQSGGKQLPRPARFAIYLSSALLGALIMAIILRLLGLEP